MSESPPCIARLQIQANAAIFQKPIGGLPSGVRPVHTTRSASVKKSSTLDTPASPACCASAGSATTAPAMNIRNIHGEQTLENAASFLKPAIARPTTTAPTTMTTATNRMSSGYQWTCGGMPNGMRTADAETVIMQPARMQNSTALSRL